MLNSTVRQMPIYYAFKSLLFTLKLSKSGT